MSLSKSAIFSRFLNRLFCPTLKSAVLSRIHSLLYLPIEFEDLFLDFRLLCRSAFIKCSPVLSLDSQNGSFRQLLRNIVLLSLNNANDDGDSLHVKCNIIETTSQGFASHHIR